MEITEQDVPLVLIIFLGSLGSFGLLLYQNFLYPKDCTNRVQKAYVVGNLFALFSNLLCVLFPSKILSSINFVLLGVLFFYFILSFFLPKGYSLPMLTWSDVFLTMLSVFFLAVRLYATGLLTYERMCTMVPIKFKSCTMIPNDVYKDGCPA